MVCLNSIILRPYFHFWCDFFLEISVNIYKEREDLITPISQYQTPTDECNPDGSLVTRGSVSELEALGLPKLLSFKVKQLEMELVQRTYDMKVSVK